MTANKFRLIYSISDWLGVLISWFSYCYIRFIILHLENGYDTFARFLTFSPVIRNGLIVSLFCMSVFYLSGYYNIVFRKSRAQELVVTFLSICVVSLGILIGVLLDDLFRNPQAVYLLMTSLFLILFFFIYFPRLLITSFITNQTYQRKIYSNTLILGTGRRAKRLIQEFQQAKHSLGYNVVGCVDLEDGSIQQIERETILGNKNSIEYLIKQYNINELIIASDQLRSSNILPLLFDLYQYSIPVYLLKDEQELIPGHSRSVSEIFSWVVLTNLTEPPITEAEKNIKLVSDYLFSALFLLTLSPIMLLIGLLVRLTSKGPCFYSQDRVGKNGKHFKIYKYRTMLVNSEPVTPLLSSPFDERMTPIGRFLRRYRLDELPQLINILKGEMSIVGPRPERQYYIDQIVKIAPYYRLLHRVKPGLTSWGMVQYGYAQNVGEMIERSQFDMRYIENCSLLLDIKIILYTIKVVFSGRGL